MKRLLIAILCGLLIAGCATIQESRVESKSSYDEVWHACIMTLSDLDYDVSTSDKKGGLIVAHKRIFGVLGNVATLNVILKESDNGVSVNVKYSPPVGSSGGHGSVDKYITALRKRIPDIKIVTSE